MAGRSSQGSRISHDGTGGSPPVYTKITNVTSIGGPSPSAPTTDVSDLDSAAKEFVAALADNGQIELALNYRGTATQMDLKRMIDEGADAEPFKIEYPTDSTRTAFDTFTFNATCVKWDLKAAVDNKQDLSVSLKVSGAVTYTPPA